MVRQSVGGVCSIHDEGCGLTLCIELVTVAHLILMQPKHLRSIRINSDRKSADEGLMLIESPSELVGDAQTMQAQRDQPGKWIVKAFEDLATYSREADKRSNEG